MPFELTHLRAGGVSVLLDHRGGLLPSIAHWGADLGHLTAQDAHAVALANAAPQTHNTPDESLSASPCCPSSTQAGLGAPA